MAVNAERRGCDVAVGMWAGTSDGVTEPRRSTLAVGCQMLPESCTKRKPTRPIRPIPNDFVQNDRRIVHHPHGYRGTPIRADPPFGG
jgi:hypothetical protein